MRARAGHPARNIIHKYSGCQNYIQEIKDSFDYCKCEDLDKDIKAIMDSMHKTLEESIKGDTERLDELDVWSKFREHTLTQKAEFKTYFPKIWINKDKVIYYEISRSMIEQDKWIVSFWASYSHLSKDGYRDADWGDSPYWGSFSFVGGQNCLVRLAELIDLLGFPVLSCRKLRPKIYKYMKEEYKDMDKAKKTLTAIYLNLRVKK